MPIFEYDCGGCSVAFEELVMSEGEEILCPDCGSLDVKRKVSTFAIHGHRSDGSSAAASSCSSGSCSSCSSGSCSSCH